MGDPEDDDPRTTAELFKETFDLVDQVAAQITPEDTERALQKILRRVDEEQQVKSWHEIPVEEAVDIRLPAAGIHGPVNEMGEPCPWPWDPQQLAGAPLGQYHCPYCGAMVLAGFPHLDYSEEPEDER